MTQAGQQITQAVYEDPEIVEGFIRRNASQMKDTNLLQSFVTTIPGKRVLDLGCGPGHESYWLAEQGFIVTGLDYSTEMIRRAQKLKQMENQPTLLVGDMRKLTDYFSENSFDGIWANASLLHIEPPELPTVLRGMTDIIISGGSICVKLKGGDGTTLVTEDKLGKPMQREYTLWTKDGFLEQVKPFNWRLDTFQSREGSLFQGQPAQWLMFFFTVIKQ